MLSVPLWALQFGPGASYLHGAAWHGHEMVFGYALAVIVGFPFTAGRNWSGRPTPGRAPADGPGPAVGGRTYRGVDAPWRGRRGPERCRAPRLAAWGLWRALHAGGNRRNYCRAAGDDSVAAGVFHLAQLGALGCRVSACRWRSTWCCS
jgi:uncharacterized protein involved in response to NO